MLRYWYDCICTKALYGTIICSPVVIFSGINAVNIYLLAYLNQYSGHICSTETHYH